MSETKVTKNEMGFTKVVDANGWTVYDFGGYKQYRKKGSFTDSLAGGAWKWDGAVSAFPVGMASLGSNFIEGQICPSDSAITCIMNQGLGVALTNQYSGAVNNFSIYWSICITEA